MDFKKGERLLQSDGPCDLFKDFWDCKNKCFKCQRGYGAVSSMLNM